MINNLKSLFPIFSKYPELAYLDNAATTQRPQSVIDSINNFYSFENSNIHRGVYDLSNKATAKFENVRLQVANFLGSSNPNCIAFTKGTTDSVNIVAQSLLKNQLKKGDNVVVTLMDHHSNFVPWQVVTKEKKAEFRIVPLNVNGDLDYGKLEELLDKKTKLLALNHVSNTLGTINNIEFIVELAHKKNVPVLIDAAQSAVLYELDSRKIDFDFLAFSGHKIFGPFGTGILYASEKYHDQILPTNFGGGMIRDVKRTTTTFSEFPHNLDAGTSNIAGVVGLSSAIDFVNTLDKREARIHVEDLANYCCEQLTSIAGVKILGSPKKRSGIISFTVEGIHPHDVASFLNKDQIAVRAGMHCTQPLFDSLSSTSSVRASFTIYNTIDEVDRLKFSLMELIKFWQ